MTANVLPPYRIKARNTSTQSENAIHHDDVAKSYGFAGGLVPGVTVYAYVTRPLVAVWGPDWLERGTASVRFTKPLFEGDEAVVGGPTGAGAEGATATVAVRTGSGGDCSTATATLPRLPGSAPDPAGYAGAPLPAERPPAMAASLAVGRVMGSPVNRYDADAAAAWLDKVDDDLALYRGPSAYVHPAGLLSRPGQQGAVAERAARTVDPCGQRDPASVCGTGGRDPRHAGTGPRPLREEGEGIRRARSPHFRG